MIELYAAQVVNQIEADHVYVKVKIPGRWRKRRVCRLCDQPAPCAARRRAVDIRAGRIDVAGRPVARIPQQRKPQGQRTPVRDAAWWEV